MMTIDYALIRFSLWLGSIQPIGLENGLSLAFEISFYLAVLIALVYVIRSVRSAGGMALVRRLPILIPAGFGLLVLTPVVTIPVVFVGSLFVSARAQDAVVWLAHAMAIGWAIWHAFGWA